MTTSRGAFSRVRNIYSGVPGYQTWLFGSYSGRYPGTIRIYIPYETHRSIYILLRHPGTEPGCLGHTRGGARVPPEYVSIPYSTHPSIYSGVPGYQAWLFWSYSGRYPGTKPGCYGHTLVSTRIPPDYTLDGNVRNV